MKQYKFGADFLHSEFKSFVYTYGAELAQAAAASAATTGRVGGGPPAQLILRLGAPRRTNASASRRCAHRAL